MRDDSEVSDRRDLLRVYSCRFALDRRATYLQLEGGCLQWFSINITIKGLMGAAVSTCVGAKVFWRLLASQRVVRGQSEAPSRCESR